MLKPLRSTQMWQTKEYAMFPFESECFHNVYKL